VTARAACAASGTRGGRDLWSRAPCWQGGLERGPGGRERACVRGAPGEPSAPRRAHSGAQGLLTYTLVPVSAEGVVSAAAVRGALRPGETAVVSLMHANNETGALQPVAEAAAAARAAGALVHCDAAQSVGKARARARDLTCC